MNMNLIQMEYGESEYYPLAVAQPEIADKICESLNKLCCDIAGEYGDLSKALLNKDGQVNEHVALKLWDMLYYGVGLDYDKARAIADRIVDTVMFVWRECESDETCVYVHDEMFASENIPVVLS